MMLMLAALLPAQTQHKTATASKQQSSAKTKGHRRHARKGSWKHHGQQGIQPERVREIQEALIREHYLTGQPSGVWDARSKEAMTRYQADNGWQSKVTPDSRALIKLGLGPNYADKDMYKATSAAASAPNSSTTRQ
jgi:hypothetical protein